MTEEQRFTANEAHRHFAVQTNGRIWTLLEKTERSAEEDDELLYAAYASCYHWLQVGTGVHQQRGEYLIAKAYMSLGDPVQCLAHARKCFRLMEQHRIDMADFDIAYADEIMARALAMNGELDQAQHHYQLALKVGAKIKRAEDKRIFDDDMAAGDWFGLL